MSATLYTEHSSRLGALLLVGERDASGRTVLTGCYLPGHRRGPAVDPSWTRDPAAFDEIRAALDRALSGQGETPGTAAAAEVPVAFVAGTPFQRRVWEELRTIPRGSTVSYGDLAARLGRPGAARAVGSAVARNPISIVVPCHRVVGSNGALTGYAGGVDRKRTLLALEGAGVSGARPV